MNDAERLAALIQERAQVATVCTEPAMIAFAAANAAALLGSIPETILVVTSPGIFKNALGASLPGTTRRGPALAAALGAVIRAPAAKLAILQGVSPDQAREAIGLLESGSIRAEADVSREAVYVKVVARRDGHTASVVVAGGHSQISEAYLDGEDVTSTLADVAGHTVGSPRAVVALELLRDWDFGRLVATALSLAPAAVAYLTAGAVSNRALGDAVLAARCETPAALGRPPLGLDLLGLITAAEPVAIDRRVRSLVAAAVAARMSGQDWPVLTSAGSGNQGITVGIPVLLAAETLGATPDRQARALVLAHAVNLYVHAFVGVVSPACGAVSAASGVAVAVCWLLGGDVVQMESAAQMTLASLLGMICDGAKGSCALKCGAGAVEGLLYGQWAFADVSLPAGVGIVGQTLRDTLLLAGTIVDEGLRQTDGIIISARSVTS